MDLADVPLGDLGDIDPPSDFSEMRERIRSLASGPLEGNAFPVLLGGEHTAAVPLVEMLAEKHEGLGVLFIDAHLDYRDRYLDDPNSHACVHRRVAELIGRENCFSLGVRSISPEEKSWLQGDGPNFLDSFAINENGIGWALEELERGWKPEKLYLSLDIDGIDPAYAPGTGTPEPFGMTPLDVKKIIGRFADRLVGFDVTEVCPPYDSGNTAALAARLVREVIAVVWKSRQK